MVDIDYTRHDSFIDISAEKNTASLVKDFNDIAGLDAFFCRVCRINPHRLISISVRPDDFTGLNLP